MRFHTWSTLKNAFIFFIVAPLFLIPAANADKDGNIVAFSEPGSSNAPKFVESQPHELEWFIIETRNEEELDAIVGDLILKNAAYPNWIPHVLRHDQLLGWLRAPEVIIPPLADLPPFEGESLGYFYIQFYQSNEFYFNSDFFSIHKQTL